MRSEADRDGSTGRSERHHSIASETNETAAAYDELSEGIIFKQLTTTQDRKQEENLDEKAVLSPSHMLTWFVLAC